MVPPTNAASAANRQRLQRLEEHRRARGVAEVVEQPDARRRDHPHRRRRSRPATRSRATPASHHRQHLALRVAGAIGDVLGDVLAIAGHRARGGRGRRACPSSIRAPRSVCRCDRPPARAARCSGGRRRPGARRGRPWSGGPGAPPVTCISPLAADARPAGARSTTRSRPSNVAGAATVSVARPPRGERDRARPPVDGDLDAGRGGGVAEGVVRANRRRAPTRRCRRPGGACWVRSRAARARPPAARPPCRRGWRGVPAAIAVSATAPLPSRRGASKRKRASPRGPRAERVKQAGGRAQRQPGRIGGRAVGLDARAGRSPRSCRRPASAASAAPCGRTARGCRSTSVSRAAPLWSTARAMPARTPGGTRIGISARPR